MQVRTINNITTLNKPKKVQYAMAECKNATVKSPVASCFNYSAENVKANFMPVSFKGATTLMDDFCD